MDPQPEPRDVMSTGEHKALSMNEDPSMREMLVRIDERTKGLDSRFVKRDEFAPIQKIVYGLTTMAIVTIFGALFALVIRH